MSDPSITVEQEARIKAALEPADYDALMEHVDHLRREAREAHLRASTEKARADTNHDGIVRLKEAQAANAHLAQVGRTVALRLANPRITFTQEQEARQMLIDAYLPGDKP